MQYNPNGTTPYDASQDPTHKCVGHIYMTDAEFQVLHTLDDLRANKGVGVRIYALLMHFMLNLADKRKTEEELKADLLIKMMTQPELVTVVLGIIVILSSLLLHIPELNTVSPADRLQVIKDDIMDAELNNLERDINKEEAPT